MTEKWGSLSSAELNTAKMFLKNVSKWSFGHSDFDWCCDDGKAPSYLLYMVTQQGQLLSLSLSRALPVARLFPSSCPLSLTIIFTLHGDAASI